MTEQATDGAGAGTGADRETAGPRGLGAHTLRHAGTLARVDVLRVLRKAIDSKVQFLAYLVTVGLFGTGIGYGSYLFGRDLGFGADLPFDATVLELARGGFGLVFLGLAILVAVRTVGTRGKLSNDVGVLSVVPTREATLGLLLSETAFVLSWLLPVALAATVGYGAGAGNWTLLATIPVVCVAVAAAAVAVGFPVGLGIRHVATRIEFVARHKGSLAVLAFLAYFALLMTNTLGSLVVALFEPLQRAPTGGYADLLFLGTTPVDVVRAVASLGLTATLTVVGAVAATRVAERHWFADPVLAGSDEDDDTGVDPDTARHEDRGLLDRFEGALGGVVGRPAAAVTVLAWKRAARAPLKLLYVAYPLLGAIGFIGEIVQTGEVPAFFPPIALVFVAWAGSVVFTLNPLGDQGSALPATVLSRIGGREFVGAHVLASALVVIPVGTALTTLLAVLSPLDLSLTAAIAVGTPLSVLVGGLFAVGVGMTFPRYDAVNVTKSTKAVVPSLVSFVVFSLYLLSGIVAATIGYEPAVEPLVAGLVSWLLPFGLDVTANSVGLAARAYLVPFAIAPFASVFHAVRRFETVTVD